MRNNGDTEEERGKIKKKKNTGSKENEEKGVYWRKTKRIRKMRGVMKTWRRNKEEVKEERGIRGVLKKKKKKENRMRNNGGTEEERRKIKKKKE